MTLKDWKINFFASVIILFSSIFHFYQCTNEPALVWDEFLYSTRAYAFIRYFTIPIPIDVIYSDHPPLGWILLGLGCLLLPSGILWTSRVRIVITVFFSLSQVFLYLIASKYHTKATGILTILLYGFQIGFLPHTRQIYLENIGIFFVLWAYYTFLTPPFSKTKDVSITHNPIRNSGNLEQSDFNQFSYKLSSFYLSGLLMGMAICVKFPFIFFIPGFFLVYYCRNGSIEILNRNAIRPHLKHLLHWIECTLLPLIVYLFVCLVLNRLGDVIQGSLDKVTQKTPGADFVHFTYFWMLLYPVFFVCLLGLLGIFLLIFIRYLVSVLRTIHSGLVNKKESQRLFCNPRMQAFLMSNFEIWGLCFGYFLFLIRGGTVNSHYMIPLYSMGSLLVGGFLVSLYRYLIDTRLRSSPDNHISPHRLTVFTLDSMKKSLFLIFSCCLLGCLLYPPVPSEFIDLQSSTSYQYDALDWVVQNVPRNASILVHTFFVAELYEASYQNVQVNSFYSPSDFNNNWRNVDYIITNSLNDMNNTFLAPAIQNSILLIQFKQDDDVINIYQVQKN